MNQKLVSRLTFFLVVLFIGLILVYAESMSSFAQAEKEVIDLVNLDFDEVKSEEFYWFNLDETYFTLEFINEDNQLTYALVAQDGGDLVYYTDSDIISRLEAIQITQKEQKINDILQGRLGKLNQTPVWEITYKEDDGTLTYYYLNAKNGKWIQTIENL